MSQRRACGRAKGFELRHLAFRRGGRRAREVAQELQHLVHGARHAGGERVVRIAGKTQQLRHFAAQCQDVLHHLRVVEAGGGSLVGGARGPCLVEAAAQRCARGVGDDGNVRGLLEPEHPALPAVFLGARARLLDHHGVEAIELRGVGGVVRERVGRIEHVLLELRGEPRKLEHHFLEALLAIRGQGHARETEVAQRVLHHGALCAVEPGAFALVHGEIRAIELLALAEIGAVRGEQRQARVVLGAQRFGVHHRVEIAHRRPAARERCCRSSTGSTTEANVGAVDCSTSRRRARFCSSSARIAGCTCSGRIASKAGSGAPRRRGFSMQMPVSRGRGGATAHVNTGRGVTSLDVPRPEIRLRPARHRRRQRGLAMAQRAWNTVRARPSWSRAGSAVPA